MSHYYPEDQRTDRLLKIRRENCCAECGRQLALYLDVKSKLTYIACSGQVHEGITREYKPLVEDYELNIRREMELEQQVGTKGTVVLAKYQGVTSLDKVAAREIINTVFPEAPEEEVAKAILLCVNYQLNPLMNHVYLIPFKRRENGQVVGTDWATVIGRGAKRLMASRRGPYSYIENTPRVMTEEEQIATFGEYDEDKLWCITRLQDPKTGATSVGYGFWPKTKSVYGKPNERQPNQPKGTDKGNSMFNMASGRSENQALDRLRPGEMPMNVAVMDEDLAEEGLKGDLDGKDFIEGEARVITEEEAPKEVVVQPEPEAEKDIAELFPPGPEVETEPVIEEKQTGPSLIDLDWLDKSMATLQKKNPTAYGEAAMVSYMHTTYKGVEGETIREIAEKLDKGGAKHFKVVIEDSLKK